MAKKETKKAIKLKTDEVLAALSAAHPSDRFAFFDELRASPGHNDSARRFDAWAFSYYPSDRNRVICYEIKVSRGDFQHELNNPLKRRDGLRLCNQFYFVTPVGLVKPEEIPPECGLIEVDENGDLHKAVPAPYIDSVPTWAFLASVFRREDKGRHAILREFKEKELRSKHYEVIAKAVMKERMEFWENYHLGDKTIPDKIAYELNNILGLIEEALDRTDINILED